MDAFPDAGNNEGCLDSKISNSRAGWWVDQERERRDTTSRTGRCLAINFVAKLLTEERSAKSISAHSTSWLRYKERSTQFSVHRMLSTCLEDGVGVGASAGNRQRVRAHAPPCNDLDTLDDIQPRDCLSARKMRARSGSGGCSLFHSLPKPLAPGEILLQGAGFEAPHRKKQDEERHSQGRILPHAENHLVSPGNELQCNLFAESASATNHNRIGGVC